MTDNYDGIGLQSLMRPVSQRKSAKKVKQRRSESRGRANSASRTESRKNVKRNQSAKSSNKAKLLDEVNFEPIVELLNGYGDAQQLLRILMYEHSKDEHLIDYIKELVIKRKTGGMDEEFVNKLYFLGEFLSPGITSQFTMPESSFYESRDLTISDLQNQAEKQFEEIEKKLFEAIYRLNAEELASLRNNGLYDTNTIKAVAGILMLLGMMDSDSMNKEVYLRFMLRPEALVEKIQAFPEHVRAKRIRPQTIDTVTTYLHKLGDIELDGTNAQIYNFVTKAIEFYQAFNNVKTNVPKQAKTEVYEMGVAKPDIIVVDRKKDLARKYTFGGSVNGLRKGPDGNPKVSDIVMKKYHAAVASQSKNKKKSPEPMQPQQGGPLRPETRVSPWKKMQANAQPGKSKSIRQRSEAAESFEKRYQAGSSPTAPSPTSLIAELQGLLQSEASPSPVRDEIYVSSSDVARPSPQKHQLSGSAVHFEASPSPVKHTPSQSAHAIAGPSVVNYSAIGQQYTEASPSPAKQRSHPIARPSPVKHANSGSIHVEAAEASPSPVQNEPSSFSRPASIPRPTQHERSSSVRVEASPSPVKHERSISNRDEDIPSPLYQELTESMKQELGDSIFMTQVESPQPKLSKDRSGSIKAASIQRLSSRRNPSNSQTEQSPDSSPLINSPDESLISQSQAGSSQQNSPDESLIKQNQSELGNLTYSTITNSSNQNSIDQILSGGIYHESYMLSQTDSPKTKDDSTIRQQSFLDRSPKHKQRRSTTVESQPKRVEKVNQQRPVSAKQKPRKPRVDPHIAETNALASAYAILDRHKKEIGRMQDQSMGWTRDILFQKIIDENTRFAEEIAQALFGKPK